MAEFFKQLISQLTAIWQKLSLQQKIITTSLIAFTIIGLAGLLIWSRGTPSMSGYQLLYSDLEVDEASAMTDMLKASGYDYKIEDNGKAILVEQKRLHEARMALAKEGLPKSHGIGYELFDKTNLAMTDFAQKLNAKRALEGELQRTVEGLEEVKSARVHIVTPEPTIFLDNQREAKASVVIKTTPGQNLTPGQVRGISYLVSASVKGLDPEHISIIDYNGQLLSDPFAGDETALASSRNLELQQKVERYLEKKTEGMLVSVLGPGKAKTQVAVDMNFDMVERTLEMYDPESRVIRSEERTDDNTKNAPDGDRLRERSLTNYEIDKTIEHIVTEVGNVKRLTISVAVDGKYDKNENGEDVYVARTAEEVQAVEDIVKNTVGYDLARGDEIVVTNLQFDNEYLRRQQEEMRKQEMRDRIIQYVKIGMFFIIGILFLLFLRSMARTLAEAMNPPVPSVETFGLPEEVTEEVPEDLKKSSELLERVEMLSREEPTNIASIIRQWLHEPAPMSRS
ncbi:MAG: flagellar M-ring protein FliF [Chitinivibrionales bacterium]|nr:flagellar M-ring protein FliF [Chitinivibrionales bacterium]